jgi:hypothetical protein
MDIIKDILDDIINYSLFFNNDEIIEKENVKKYTNYLEKKINKNYCESYFEQFFSITNIDVITLEDYLQKLIKVLCINNSVMISAFIYLERLNINLNSHNIHLLLLVSLLLSSKFVEDLYYNNKYWAKYGGISLSKLNRLEKIYLIKIKNNLFINITEFYDKFNKIFK